MRWLLVGATAAMLFGITFIMRILNLPESLLPFYRTGSTLTGIAGMVVLLLGLTGTSTISLLLMIITFLLIPILYGILIWVKVFDAEEMQT